MNCPVLCQVFCFHCEASCRSSLGEHTIPLKPLSCFILHLKFSDRLHDQKIHKMYFCVILETHQCRVILRTVSHTYFTLPIDVSLPPLWAVFAWVVMWFRTRSVGLLSKMRKSSTHPCANQSNQVRIIIIKADIGKSKEIEQMYKVLI